MAINLVTLDFSTAEGHVMAILTERQRNAILHLETGGTFYWSDCKGPSVNDLVELGFIRKRYAATRRGDVTDIYYLNDSGKEITVDGVTYKHGDFLDY